MQILTQQTNQLGLGPKRKITNNEVRWLYLNLHLENISINIYNFWWLANDNPILTHTPRLYSLTLNKHPITKHFFLLG